MPTFVTSDTHLGHANILQYCPWRQTWASSIEEHDAKLIAAWNAVVGKDDTVLHLGDFAFGTKARFAHYVRQLHGFIVLVRGNHDRVGKAAVREAGVLTDLTVFRSVSLGKRFICRHRPQSFTPDDQAWADVLLHGHTHGERPDQGKLVDVGIDAMRDLAPQPLDQVLSGRRAA